MAIGNNEPIYHLWLPETFFAGHEDYFKNKQFTQLACYIKYIRYM